jgi:hypothetical protein
MTMTVSLSSAAALRNAGAFGSFVSGISSHPQAWTMSLIAQVPQPAGRRQDLDQKHKGGFTTSLLFRVFRAGGGSSGTTSTHGGHLHNAQNGMYYCNDQNPVNVTYIKRHWIALLELDFSYPGYQINLNLSSPGHVIKHAPRVSVTGCSFPVNLADEHHFVVFKTSTPHRPHRLSPLPA